jgi:predicted nucleic acid-binding protein
MAIVWMLGMLRQGLRRRASSRITRARIRMAYVVNINVLTVTLQVMDRRFSMSHPDGGRLGYVKHHVATTWQSYPCVLA